MEQSGVKFTPRSESLVQDAKRCLVRATFEVSVVEGQRGGGNHCRSFMRPLRKVGKKGKKRRGRERGWEGKEGGGGCDDPGDGKVGPQATQGHTPHAAPAATGEGKKIGLRKGGFFGGAAWQPAGQPRHWEVAQWAGWAAGRMLGRIFCPPGARFFFLSRRRGRGSGQWDGGVGREVPSLSVR